ncbi:6070_t:CDS:2 [Gigaspora rosea]|nr:6070_t:CDS:2 [Gigaspora rosea]
MAQPPHQQQPPPLSALNLNNPMHNLANQIAALIQQIKSPTTTGMIGTNSSINENTSSNRTEEALNRLTEVVTRMMSQMQDQRKPFRPRLLGSSTTQNPGIVCYNCGRPGHISQQCSSLRNSSSNNPPVHQASTQTTLTVSSNSNISVPDPLQTLYTLLNNSNVMNSQGNPSYLGIPEDAENLFLLADHHICKTPIAGTEILRKKKTVKVLDTSSGLVETKEIVNLDVDMAEGQEEPGITPEERHESEPNKKINQKVPPK